MNEKENVSESANELETIKDIVTDIQSNVGYMMKLLETLVDNLSLANKSKVDSQKLMKMNTDLMTSLFSGKNFEGKEKFMEILSNLQNLGE